MSDTHGYTDSLLDEMRTIGDPVADKVVAELFATGEVGVVDKLMMTLVRNDGIPSDQLPQIVRDYLTSTQLDLPPLDMEKVRLGEDVFGYYGPECLMCLGFYSLPASYAAAKGVHVLYRTAYLVKKPMRRVFETTQMVVDVMAKDGLGPTGKGVRTAQKVRLMHAAVRHMLQNDPKSPWDAKELGVPINQEDLAGTLMTFSYCVIEGLERLGITLNDDQQDAYLHAWQAIGKIMGVEARVIPATIADAKALTLKIRERQIAASDEGKAMTKALIDGYVTLIPHMFEGLAATMIRHFLAEDQFMNQDVATMLGVPPANWTEIFVLLVEGAGHLLHWLGDESNTITKVIRSFSRIFVQAMLTVERGGNRPPFEIPSDLKDIWKIDGGVG